MGLTSEPAMVCRGGCGRSLHARCAAIAKGNVSKGNFTCLYCLMKSMGAEGHPSEEFMDEVTELSLVELTLGRDTTSAGHQTFVSLTEKWVEEKKAQGLVKILSPTENLESFKSFACWMILRADRERSFRTTMRAASGYLTLTHKPDFTKDKYIKRLFRELNDICGTEAQPMTHGTRRMLAEALYRYIPAMYSHKPNLLCRERVQLAAESVGCLRATESCMAVEGHGLAANDCFILKDSVSDEVSVELKIHDSKTGMDRWVNMAGETLTTRIPVATYFMDLFKNNKLSLATGSEGGFAFIQPDSWAVKLSLLAVPHDFVRRLSGVLDQYSKTAQASSVSYRTRLIKYAEDAERSTTGGEAHKYVLLNEGPRMSGHHTTMMLLLEEAGLGRMEQEINLIPAPLLRATHNAGNLLMPMPYTYGAAYAMQEKMFKEVHLRVGLGGEPDPEFDLQGHAVARFGQHSWRRLGEKVARDSKDFHQLEDTDTDLYSGWDLHEHSRDMQLHYAGQQRSIRVKRRRLTMMM